MAAARRESNVAGLALPLTGSHHAQQAPPVRKARLGAPSQAAHRAFPAALLALGAKWCSCLWRQDLPRLLELSMRRLVFALALVFAAASPVHAEKVLRYAFQVAETGFDPAQLTDLYSRNVTANIFDAPLRFKWLEPGTFEPNTLASMPEVSADFRTFTFHLKPGIYFAPDPAFNGKKRELVAEDYVFSFKRIYDPRWHSESYGGLEPLKIASLEALRSAAEKSGHFDYDTQIEGIRAIDRYTWQVHLGVPSPRFAEANYSDPSIFGALAREVVEKYGDAIMEHPVGTGAYMLSTWVRSSRMVLVKNPNYRVDIFNAHPPASDVQGQEFAARFNGKRMPFIDRIEISIVEESQPRWLAFLNAEHDVLTWVPQDLTALAMPNNRLAPTLVKKHVYAQRSPEPQTYEMLFNMDDPLVGGYTPEKVALRRAMALGLDTPRLIAQVMNYQAIPAQSNIDPGQYTYDPALRTEMGEYDPARANAILDSYGYLPRHGGKWRDLPDGTPFTIPILATPDQLTRNIDEIIKKSADQLGIRVEFETAKWPDQLKKTEAGTYSVWYLGESANSLDPSGNYQSDYGPAKGGANLSRFDVPEYNELYQKSEELPNGPEREAALHRMMEILIAYMPDKLTMNVERIHLNYPWVLGFRHDALVADWWKYVDIDSQMQKPHLR